MLRVNEVVRASSLLCAILTRKVLMSRFLRFETGICDLNGFCGFSAEGGYYSHCIRRSNRIQ